MAKHSVPNYLPISWYHFRPLLAVVGEYGMYFKVPNLDLDPKHCRHGSKYRYWYQQRHPRVK